MTEKTFVVLGCSFSGTSMTAGLMRKMGIFMGERFNDSGNHEDLDFQLKGIQDVREAIQKRNKVHLVWGWKDPYTIDHIDAVIDLLVNPHFIIVFRDVAAIARRMIQKYKTDFKTSVLLAHSVQTRLVNFINSYTYVFPMFEISFEKAYDAGGLFVRELSDFCDIKLDEYQIQDMSEWMKEKKYKPF